MTTILHLRCSPRGAAAFSSRMAEEVVARLLRHHEGAEIVFRDLSADPPPLVDAGFSAAILGPPGRGAARAGGVRDADPGAGGGGCAGDRDAHAQLLRAGGAEGVGRSDRPHPSHLRQHAGRQGRQIARPAGVAGGRVGGWFTGPSPSGAPAQPDFLTPYVRAVLNTIGIHDLHVLTLEGVTRGADIAEAAFGRARAALDRALPPE